MAVELHIRRWRENSDYPEGISLDEWKVAVENCDNVRLCQDEFWVNPVTKRKIERPVRYGDVEVFDGYHWILAIYWVNSGLFRGSASFNVRAIEDFSRSDWLLGRAVCLCDSLNANLVTDELTVLDLYFFEPIRQLSYPVSPELKRGMRYALNQLVLKLERDGFQAEGFEISQLISHDTTDLQTKVLVDFLYSIAFIKMSEETRILFGDTLSALRDSEMK